jgi:predicted NBD/HSP70 family sugar kinase
MRFIAADLGGTTLRCGVAASDGSLEIVERHELAGARFRGPGRWTAIVTVIADFAKAHLRRSPGAPIVLSFPGPLRDGAPWIAPTVTGGGEVPDLGRMITRATGRTCTLLNDVSAAAWYFAGRLSARRFGVVTVSSGIGFKVFDRHADPCVNDDAGEIGHLVIDDSPGAPLCECGGRGHLGAIASGRAIERAARDWARCERLTNEEHVVPAFLAGDDWAADIIDAAAQPLARVLATVIVANGLGCVAVMGGFAQAAGPAYLASLRRTIASQAAPGPASVAPDALLLAAAADQPSLSGAAIFGARRLAA